MAYVVLEAGAVSAQAQNESDEYHRAIAGALQEYNVGNFAEAQALFERGHALRPSARTFRGIGMTCFELKKYLRAREALQAALQDSRQPLTPVQRRESEQLLERTAAYIGTLQVHAVPETASVLLDGEAVSGERNVELGNHELTIRAPGYRDLTRQISIEGGKRQELSFTLVAAEIGPAQAARAHVADSSSPEATGSTPTKQESASVLGQWWFWTAAGAIIAGGVITAVALTSQSKNQALEPGDTGGVIYARGVARVGSW